ncbi:hypothetical protein B0H14DRAFT_3458988 [Mycena olivaceomarginata]|nr:hypothetical protein B0H14DRAFT_3458988 [Mycena olivaceomarginata]
MSELAVYRSLRLQTYEEIDGMSRRYMRYIEIVLAWSLREARAQSRRELEVGLALVRRRNALVNEYRRVTYLLMLSYDIGCQWRLNRRHVNSSVQIKKMMEIT